MESKLYEAAMKGNVSSLLELLRKDKLLLDRVMTGNHTETPLHIAAMLGHLDFVEEVLARKAELAREQDSQISPEICFVRDKYKRNPLHIAAVRGHVDVLECLVQVRPDAARSVVEHGQTILHLCVKHNRLEALKLLTNLLSNDQFINSRDEDGNTILHLAAIDRQTETTMFLINKGVNPNITNFRGLTALDLLEQGESTRRASEIKDSIHQISENLDPPEQKDERERKRKWQDSMHETLMVVATLLATMAFQLGNTPPGGIWQDDFPGDGKNAAHTAGESIMANKYFDQYKYFVTCNTISFIASLSVIMLLISGLPLKRHPILTWIAMLAMWVAITFTATTYAISIIKFTPESKLISMNGTVGWAVLAWAALMILIFLCHVARLILKLVRKVQKLVLKAWKKRKPEDLIA
ncbi:hypothetical protein EUGRSUZ_B00705 [Eucalyptus grandis]|uniref:Uncharacterized protein n=2 Tax=Eucalyptus grandis TaxID=71139 RepID=A0ACC3LN16_EUCGR|nr:hypothetical protein EUGRSUZ_B00705 [Eucalyptus grandis]